ncbi:MAG: glycosyltransferase [Candidatus Taylorbacteria bacterium]|nr:glycosyltransferase [Candidatus Taylorbacteria bacterium]
MEKELSVVIPTYNEKKNLQILIPKILAVFRKNQLDGEIIVVDDRSGDGSFEYLSEQVKLIPELKVIFRDPPPSLAGAWFEGFEAASKKYVASIDADLCYEPELLPVMLKKMKDFDMVIGSRYVNNRFSMMKGKPVFPVLLSIISQFITRLATGLTVYDTSSGFRLFKKKVFNAIKDKLKTKGNTFLIEFSFYAKENGARIMEIPIEYGERIYGATKLKISREGFRYLRFIIKTFLRHLPLFRKSGDGGATNAAHANNTLRGRSLFKIIAASGLSALLLFSLIRLYGNINRFGQDGVQRDFSVYYTAGQSLNAGFPIYQNGIVREPPIWDGNAIYTYSRFIYPPLVAVPFELMANMMTYGTAKFFWLYFSLACLLASIFITIRALKLKLRFWQCAAVGIYASLFFPLLTFIALGQIDALTLLLALTAISLASSGSRREMASGFFWAFATLIKLHIGLVVLFFILRKQWKMLAGYLLGGATIVVLTVLFLGPNILGNYLTKELPRFVQNGSENGPAEAKLPESYFAKYYSEYGLGHPDGFAKDGHWFKDVKISFSPNASLSRFIVLRLQDINKNWQISASLISFLLLAFFLPLAFLGLKKIRMKTPQFSPEQEFLYWYAVLMVLLLLGPLTWVMNTIWLIPLAALAVGRHPWSSDKMHPIPWFMLVVALILAFVPDCMYLGWRDFASPSWGCKMLDSSKYTFSELLIIASIWLQLGGLSLFDKKEKGGSHL